MTKMDDYRSEYTRIRHLCELIISDPVKTASHKKNLLGCYRVALEAYDKILSLSGKPLETWERANLTDITECKVWRVVIDKKLWELDAFRCGFTRPTTIQQSKGNSPMTKKLPARGDKAVFVAEGKIVMRGIVVSDGFVGGIGHQVDTYNLGSVRKHADPPEYADVHIENVYSDDDAIKVPHKGQATWNEVSEHWWCLPTDRA